MQRFSSRIRAFERKRDSSLSLSLSLSLCYKSISNAVRVAKHKKKRSQRTSLSSSKSSFSVTLRTKNAKRERETNTSWHKLNPKHISNTLNKKKLQLICSQSALTLPSDWRSSEHHANESFFPRATCIIARQWERAFWWILAAERFLFERVYKNWTQKSIFPSRAAAVLFCVRLTFTPAKRRTEEDKEEVYYRTQK
jgi:hypothetical protein